MIDISKVPGEVTITNNGTKEANILSRPGYSQGFVLPAGETVKILAEHSYELVSLLAQEGLNPDLEVTLPTERIS